MDALARNSQLYQGDVFLKNCLCLLPTGSLQGNSEKRWLFFTIACSLLSNVVPRHRFQGAWHRLCC